VHRRRVFGSALLGLALLAAGCSKTVAGHAAPALDLPSLPSGPSAPGLPGSPTAAPTEDPNAPATITIEFFSGDGITGLRKLAADYHASHPKVTVRIVTAPQDLTAYWAKMQVEIGFTPARVDLYTISSDDIGRLAGSAGKWSDLNTLGADSVKADYYPAAWAAATAPDGKLYGLPRDFTPVQICYRRDLLGAAGLPTDRAALAGAWRSWQAYLASGRQFAARNHSASFADSPSTLFRGIVGGSKPLYYADDGSSVLTSNPAIRGAFQLSLQAVASKLTFPATPFSPEWVSALQAGKIATVLCPPWMLGFLQTQSGPGPSQWDVTAAPTVGQWGSSFLSIPANSAHPKAAYAFARWLTAADREAAAFTRIGAFPANQRGGALLANSTNAAFHNAPVGRLFAAAAGAVPATRYGPHVDSITDAIGQTLADVATGKQPAANAWNIALIHARAAAAR
jgi:cellobiose transport system substrate-binding protein